MDIQLNMLISILLLAFFSCNFKTAENESSSSAKNVKIQFKDSIEYYSNMNNLEKSNKYSDSLVKKEPKGENFLLRAEIRYNLNDFQGAYADLMNAKNLGFTANDLLVLVLISLHRYEQALDLNEKMLKEYNDSLYYLFVLSHLSAEKKELEKFDLILKKIRNIDSSGTNMKHFLAKRVYLLLELGDTSQACRMMRMPLLEDYDAKWSMNCEQN